MNWIYWGLGCLCVSALVSLVFGRFVKVGRGNDETNVGE